jgi:hypothetical protein
MFVRFRFVAALALVGLVACDDGDDGSPATQADAQATTDGSPVEDAAASDGGGDAGADATPDPDVGPPDWGDPDCDPLDPGACALPWPSSLYLAADAARATGYTLALGAGTLPASVTTGAIDPTPWRRMDGYGLGVPILAIFPELDASGLAGEYDVAESLAEDAAILLLEVTDAGTRRVPYFAELDALAPEAGPATLIVRPAEILRPDTRYVVAFRGLRSVGGAPIPPSAAFAALRDGVTEGDPVLGPRQAGFDEVLALLDGEGVDRATLTLAWDFHTASEDALYGRMLHMRDDGLAAVGADGPEITFEQIDLYAPEADDSGREVNPYTAVRIRGTARMPHYMKLSDEFLGVRGWIFNLGDDGQPAQDGWRDARFWINIPHGALTGDAHGLVMYGHGLFGDGKDVADLGWTRLCGQYPPRECGWFIGRIANQHDLIFFSADLLGMAANDRDETALTMIQNLGWFPWLSDRLHQGLLEYVLLTRGMKQRLQAALDAHEMTRDLGITVDPTQVYYSGISQGGIFGPTFLALSPDVRRGHLGVPGMNYSTLLGRSVDFEPFFGILMQAHPDRIDQLVMLAAIQQLWDTVDPVSYYPKLSAAPFPGNAPSHVIAAPARGDYQVSPMTLEIAARSDVGLAVMANYDADRSVELVEPVPYPHTGSGIVLWHFGNPWPMPGNRPPPEDEWGDPHESGRHDDPHNEQMVHFFRTGEIIDVCDGVPCPNEP